MNMRELIDIVESAEAQALEEGLLTKAAVLGSLLALLVSAGVNPPGNPEQALNSEINQIMQDMVKDDNSADAWNTDPYAIANMFGVPVKSIIDPKATKDFGKPTGGLSKDSLGADGYDWIEVGRLYNDIQPNHTSPVYNSGSYRVHVIRSSNIVTEQEGAKAYISTCLIDASVTLDTGTVFASKLLKFYHTSSKEIDKLDKCNPQALIKHLEAEFRSNPVYYVPGKA